MVEGYDVAEGRKRSREVRELWLQNIVSGEVTIDDVLAYSRTKERDAMYVSGIRLSTILEELPGWSDAAAINVLTKNGFKQNDTIKTLRSFVIKASKFKHIFELPPPSFATTRPEMPRGWPWQGKLADLVRVTGKAIPSLEYEGIGDADIAAKVERKIPAFMVPQQRANALTGEIIDPQPFWESKQPDVAVQPAEINENDIAELFWEESTGKVDDSDIEALLG